MERRADRAAEADAHYRAVMADPEKRSHYCALAEKKRIPVSSLVMGEYCKRASAEKSGDRKTPKD